MADLDGALARLFARPIAHRGLHACGGTGPVENSIAAARAAIDAGYGIECDVQLTRDGEAVVFHDDALERLTGAPGLIGDRTAGDLAALCLIDGSPIPTLAAFLAAIDERTPLVIEIKSAADGNTRLADTTLRHVAGYAGPVGIESFDPAVVARCRGAPCPVGLVGPADDETIDPDTLARCDFVSWDIAHLATVAARHPRLPRTTWTVRSEAQEVQARALGAQIVFEGFRP